MTARAGVRRGGGRQQKAAAAAFPVGLATAGAEFDTIRIWNRRPAVRTFLVVIICHFQTSFI